MDYTTVLRHLRYTALIELYPACGRLRVIYLSFTIFASTSHLSLLPLTSTSHFYLSLLPLTSTSYFYLLLLPLTSTSHQPMSQFSPIYSLISLVLPSNNQGHVVQWLEHSYNVMTTSADDGSGERGPGPIPGVSHFLVAFGGARFMSGR
ncbi:hypothetical protein PSPO01_01748 [Paraphaeosphaeria sporulosa]